MKKVVLTIIVIIFILFGVLICSNYNLDRTPKTTQKITETKLRICPDYWYDNQMPCGCVDINCSDCKGERQYFIINETKRELVDFDVDWIKKNCEVNKPEVVV